MQALTARILPACRHEHMETIIINSQKGGSAKTMLAKHLSVEAERAGDGPVFLIDTDPPGQPDRLAQQARVRHPAASRATL